MERQQQLHQSQKFVLKTTCLKNGGFRKYQPLPPQEVFQHAYWVLGSELDVKIKRKQTFFNRETDWMGLPAYLTTNKGLLFLYVNDNFGYVLRIASALKINFEGTKKIKKRPQPGTPNFTYIATIVLHFHFGELHLRFINSESLRKWRAILLASHQSQNGVSKIGEFVAKEIFGSTSLESVVSAKSVIHEKNDKDKTERVEIHRHPMIPAAAAPKGNESVVEEEEGATTTISPTTISPTTSTTSSIQSAVKSPKCIKSISDVVPCNAFEKDDFEINADLHLDSKVNIFDNIESESNESVLEHENHAMMNPFSPAPKTSRSHLTSEVNVSFEDLEPVSVISNNAAFKTGSVTSVLSGYRTSPSAQFFPTLSPLRDQAFSFAVPTYRTLPYVQKSQEMFATQEWQQEKPALKSASVSSLHVLPNLEQESSVAQKPFSPAIDSSKSHFNAQVDVSINDDNPVSSVSDTVLYSELDYFPNALSPISEHYTAESSASMESSIDSAMSPQSLSSLSVHTAIEREYADVDEDSPGDDVSTASYKEYWREVSELDQKYKLRLENQTGILKGFNPDGSVVHEIDGGNGGGRKPMSMMERVLIEVNKRYPNKSETEIKVSSDSNNHESRI